MEFYIIVGCAVGITLVYFLAVYVAIMGNLLFFNILLIAGAVVIAICASYVIIGIGLNPEFFMPYSWRQSERQSAKRRNKKF